MQLITLPTKCEKIYLKLEILLDIFHKTAKHSPQAGKTKKMHIREIVYILLRHCTALHCITVSGGENKVMLNVSQQIVVAQLHIGPIIGAWEDSKSKLVDLIW